MPLDNPEETFEVFSEDGTLERLVSRSIVHREGLWHKSVNVFLTRRDGCVLLQQRASKKDVCPGLWDLSCGEHLIPGESCEQAARRGLWEELGINIETTSLKTLGPPARCEFRDDSLGVHDREIQQSFLAYSDSSVQFDVTEVSAIQWTTWAALITAVDRTPASYTPWLVKALASLPLNHIVEPNG